MSQSADFLCTILPISYTHVMIIYLQHVLAKKNICIHGAHCMDCKVLYRQLNYLTYLQDRYHLIFKLQFENEQCRKYCYIDLELKSIPLSRSLIPHSKLWCTVLCETVGSPGWEAQAERKGWHFAPY